MSKHIAKPSFFKRILKSGLAGFIVSIFVLASLNFAATSAQAAITIDVSATTFKFDFPTNGTLISGASKETSGSVVKFSNITQTPVGGVSVDAIVTMTLTSSSILPTGSGQSNGTYDSPGKAGSDANFFQVDTAVSAANGNAEFKFDFYEAGTYTGLNTGTPVILKNLSVTTIDIDGNTGYCQYTDFTGFQAYYLSASTAIRVKTHATDPSTVPAGVTRFLAGSCANNSNRVEDAAQIKFDAVSTFSTKFGTDAVATINYFGIGFKPLSAIFGGTQPAGVTNPSNQPPTSSGTTRYYVNGQASIVQLPDFGNYTDPDGNPFIKVKITTLPTTGTLQKFVNGSWVSVNLNDEILVTDISNGNLRFTGSVNDTLQFKVSDGIDYSTAAYTMTLLVSNQSQTITFANPGAKTPTSPSFASGATASSGLTVTLTSLTPGVCTVSGLNISPVTSGTCTIVASQAGNSTYGAATSVTQTFPISTLTAQTITAPNPGDQTWSGTSSTITVSPTASSGLTVSLISLNTAVCTVSGFVITIVGPGNCSIRNVQSGNGTYSAAPPVEYTFVVSAPVVNYAITYDGNTKTSGSVPSNTTGNGSVTLASNTGTLTKTGYTFAGWNTNARGTGTQYNTGASYNLTADITLYAEWTAIPVVYTITYDGNGKTSGSIPSNTTGNGNVTLATNTGTLAKTAFTFNGWNTAADGTGTHYNTGASYNLTADITLYAEWSVIAPTSFTITFDGNGNTGGTSPAAITGSGNKNLRDNTGNLTITGYNFNGWNTMDDGSGTHYDVNDIYNLGADVTLYAEWIPVTYTITYDGNGNTGGSTPSDTTGFGEVSLATNDGTLIKTGYTFAGWNTLADGTGTHYNEYDLYSLGSDLTLYSEWTAIPASYTITFDGNGNTGGTAPAVITGSGNKTLRNNTGSLAKTGYTFTGWNTAADGTGTHYNTGTSFNLTAEITLYAEWTAIPVVYTITYDGNGKTSGSIPSNTTGNGNVTLATNTGTLAKTAVTFNGWNTAADGTGTHYNTGTSYNLTADVTLYAEWSAIAPTSFTITFDGNGNTGGTTPAAITGSGNKTLRTNSGTLVKASYRFMGWNTAADGTGTHYNTGASYNLSADVTLYAEWILTPAVIYNGNGSTSGTTPSEIPANITITIDANIGNLERTGFRFLGWNTQANGAGTRYAAGMTPILPPGTVLYAEWQKVPTLASTGSNFGDQIATGATLIGLGLVINAFAIVRRRRIF